MQYYSIGQQGIFSALAVMTRINVHYPHFAICLNEFVPVQFSKVKLELKHQHFVWMNSRIEENKVSGPKGAAIFHCVNVEEVI